MNIIIHQPTGEIYNHDVLSSAIKFFTEQLLTTKEYNRLNTIKLSLINFADHGECVDYSISEDRKVFVLRVNRKLSFPEIISTIAHEMVHVKQTMDGSFYSDDKCYKWKNKKYPLSCYDNLTQEDEYALPWEKLAYDAERTLSKKFFNYYFDKAY